MVWLGNKYENAKWMQLLLTFLSASAGCYLVYMTNSQPALGVMLKAPGVATLWVYTILVLDLSLGLGALASVGLYYLVFIKR